MKGNFHVQFLGEGVAATSPPYPTPGWATTPVYPAQCPRAVYARPTVNRSSAPDLVLWQCRGQPPQPLGSWRLFPPSGLPEARRRFLTA